MGYIKLTSTFQTRVRAMDAEHERLVEIINHMYEIYEKKGSQSSLVTVLDDLLEYGRRHFANEEAYMRQIQFPGLTAHQLVHKDLISQATHLKRRLVDGEVGVDEDTFRFLQNWLMGHIVGTDVKDYGMSEALIEQLSEQELMRLADSLDPMYKV